MEKTPISFITIIKNVMTVMVEALIGLPLILMICDILNGLCALRMSEWMNDYILISLSERFIAVFRSFKISVCMSKHYMLGKKTKENYQIIWYLDKLSSTKNMLRLVLTWLSRSIFNVQKKFVKKFHDIFCRPILKFRNRDTHSPPPPLPLID